MILNKIYNEDARATIERMSDESLNCIVTSPPYFNLRDYNIETSVWPAVTFKLYEFMPDITIPAMECCLGLESSPIEYIAHLVYLFRASRPKLKNDGTIWINIGDSYAAAGKKRSVEQACRKSTLKGTMDAQIACKDQNTKIINGIKPKDMIGIPWMLAFALRSDGWYLRQDIIWSKKRAMPESVKDRCTRSHEVILMLSKSSRYYYDYKSIRTQPATSSLNRWKQDVDNQKGSTRANGGNKTNGNLKAVGGPKQIVSSDRQRGHSRRHSGFNEHWDKMSREEQMSFGANKRSVWTVATSQRKEKHFATYNGELIKPMILAGCPIDGVVYDPFMGSGTTGIEALKLSRNFIGSEMSSEYMAIANKRLIKEASQNLLYKEIHNYNKAI